MNRWVAWGAAVLLTGGIVQAADITWGAATNYAAATDVATEGTLVEAVNACGVDAAVSPIINGVQFTANTDLMSSDASITFLYGDTGDTNYNNLLNTLDYGSSQFTVGNGQLILGKEYLIQIWYLDERSKQDARAMQFGDGNGNLSAAVNDQYIIGSFFADSTNQTITVNGVDGVTPHVNAYQLRVKNSLLSTLSTTAGDAVTGAFSVTTSFSESVTGLEASDFTVVNGTASGISGSGTNWTATITPTGNGDVSVTLPADSVVNGEGHSNLPSNTLLTTYVAPGSEQPVATLSTASSEVTGPFSVTIDFSEDITGLELSDFEVMNGTTSNLTGSGASYSMEIHPNQNGAVWVRLKRSAVTDMDGDTLPNPASDELSVIHYLSVAVSSLAELKPWLAESYVNVTLAPGTYTIAADAIENGTFDDKTTFTIDDRTWSHSIVLKFAGNYSTYDFTGVTLYFSSGLWHDYDYGDNGVYQIETTGNYNVLKNLTMIDDGTVDDDPRDGCVNVVMDGAYNRIEGFHITARGSYPYGYGDCFGKGGTNNTISHNKHSSFLVRGESNHAKNCTLIHRSYGHCMFMQAASNPTIEGCYIEGEVRSTDDMLAETSGPAYDIDFLTTWGYRLPPGYMKSTGEGGIRAYNAGETVIDGVAYSRGTSNPTIINDTVINMRTGVTLTHATGTKYVAGCKTIGCERGYAIGSGIIENCSGDVQHGPIFGVDYESDSGVIADITILPYKGDAYNGSHHFAYIYGKNHKLTFRGINQTPDQSLEINVGGDKRIESNLAEVENLRANDILINNYTGYPLVLDDASTNITGRSIGTVTDDGYTNSFESNNWSIATNATFYSHSTQSSSAYDTIAALATDQNTNGQFGDGSVTHTDNDAQAWWRLDLKQPFNISEIKIWGRSDSNQSRLSNYDVSVLDEDEHVIWTSYQSSYPNPMISLNTGSVTGRYVNVQLRGTERLSMAELQIFGAPISTDPEIAVFTTATTFAPEISTNDLAQSQYLSSSATGGNESAEHATLFNGMIGNKDSDSDDIGEVRLSSENTVTVTFDTSVHTNGYDLTGINTYFGWDPSAQGRSNQGYEIILTYVDDSTGTLVGPAHWQPNSPATFYWTKVAFTEASNGVMASGVKAVTFNITEDANAGGFVVARELDVFGTPSTSFASKDYTPEFTYGGTTLSNGLFSTQISGELGADYTVEWTPALTNTSWQTVTNISGLETSPFSITMPATNNTSFFRVIWNP